MTKEAKTQKNGGKMKKTIKTAAGMLSGMLTILLFVIALYSLMAAVREKKDGIPFFLYRWKPVLVLSDSMEPTIHTGSVIIVRKQEGRAPETGDIVLYRREGEAASFVTHRISGQDSGGYITKGDHNNTPDPGRRDADDILGTVVTVLF